MRVHDRDVLYRYVEVDPVDHSRVFDREMQAAMALLKASNTEVARDTLRALTTGAVKVDVISDMTRADFLHLQKDLRQARVGLRRSDYRTIGNERSRAYQAIVSQINGYQWDDRIYVVRGMSAHQLARTLVHEATHVRNRSEEHYRGGRAILLEEYRSFYAEQLFAGIEMTAARCRALKRQVIRDYGISGVTADEVPDHPPGL